MSGRPSAQRLSHSRAPEAERVPTAPGDEEWPQHLDPARSVLRKRGTERAAISASIDEKRRATFLCAGCGEPPFASEARLESAAGRPCCIGPLEGGAATSKDSRWIIIRSEVDCSDYGGHRGQVFVGRPRMSGLRYGRNVLTLAFPSDRADDQLAVPWAEGVRYRSTNAVRRLS